MAACDQGSLRLQSIREYVEGAELHFLVVPAGMERIEIGDPVNA